MGSLFVVAREFAWNFVVVDHLPVNVLGFVHGFIYIYISGVVINLSIHMLLSFFYQSLR